MRRIIATSPDPALNWAILDYLDATLNWRERWDDFDAMDATSWPDTIERAHDLNAFAFCGMLPGWSLPDADVQADQFTDVPGHIRRSIELLNGFVGLLPNAREFYGIASLQRTCLAAEARLKIDDGAALTVHELAAVTKVTTKRLQNAIYAKTEDAPIPGKDGLIASESAARWLKAREYLPSIWQEFIAGRCWEADGSEELNPCEEPSRENTERYFFGFFTHYRGRRL